MNDNVVPFPSKEDKTVYQKGTALCISCRHECACKNNLFYINPDGIYCPNCGKVQVFPKNV